MIRERKIPTIIGFLILILGLGAGVFLVQRGQVFFLRATPEITPAQIKITNLSSSSFSVSWLTEKETSGFIKFGETVSLEQIALDDRDQLTGSTGSFITHHVTLKNLKSKTRYLFKIGSENIFFDDNGKPYEITTAQTISGSPPPSDVVSGTILNPDGDPAEGAIVYLTLGNVVPQSTLVRSGGTWFVPLNAAYSQDLLSFANYDKEAQVEEIFVQDGKNKTAQATTTSSNDNPVPEITLGKTYDFRRELPEEIVASPTTGEPSPTPSEQTPTPPSSKFSFTEIITPTPATQSVQLTITNPTKEGEKINSPKPEFRGTGPAGKTIQIIVESPNYIGTATIQSDGDWTWSPPTNLSPGEHKITISYLGKTLTRTFTVLAVGASEIPSFTATPSATPTIKPTPTTIPSATPTPRPSITPTPIPVTTATPTPKPTTTLTPTATPSARTSLPSTEGGIPKSGDLTPTFMAFIIGFGFILSGFVLKLLAHGR